MTGEQFIKLIEYLPTIGVLQITTTSDNYYRFSCFTGVGDLKKDIKEALMSLIQKNNFSGSQCDK